MRTPAPKRSDIDHGLSGAQAGVNPVGRSDDDNVGAGEDLVERLEARVARDVGIGGEHLGRPRCGGSDGACS